MANPYTLPWTSSRKRPTTRARASSPVRKLRTMSSDSGASLFSSVDVAPSRVITRVFAGSMNCIPSRSHPTTSIGMLRAATLVATFSATDILLVVNATMQWEGLRLHFRRTKERNWPQVPRQIVYGEKEPRKTSCALMP